MSDAASRPGAEGHRFGPDLSCSECGVTWEAHQIDPRKCVDDVVAEPTRGIANTHPAGGSEVGDAEVEPATPEPKKVGLATAVSAALQARAVGTD